MQNAVLALQRVQTIQQRIGYPRNDGAFSIRLERAIEDSKQSDPLPSSAQAPLMTIGSWLGVTPTTAGSSPLATPVVGEWGSGFGIRSDPFTGEARMHSGVDISAPEGAPIRAAAGGVVSFAGANGGYGNLVIIDHPGGIQTYYAHQSLISVAVGDDIAAGEEVGRIGSTGRSTGPHLHFEVRIDGEAVDPNSYLLPTYEASGGTP